MKDNFYVYICLYFFYLGIFFYLEIILDREKNMESKEEKFLLFLGFFIMVDDEELIDFIF